MSFGTDPKPTPENEMQANTTTSPWPKRIGAVLSGLCGLLFMFSASAKLSADPKVLEGFAKLNIAPLVKTIGIVEIACALVYLIPQTAVLGAVLLTGYLGGAVMVHLVMNDTTGNILTPVIIGVLVWGALWLRDPRLRALMPLRLG
jgi:hypothetical protein